LSQCSSHYSPHLLPLPSFPPRRSSDLPHPFASAFERRHYTFRIFLAIERNVDPELIRELVDVVQRPHIRANDYNRDIDGLGKLRSEEHTSELQSRFDIVCRLLLEKKKQ